MNKYFICFVILNAAVISCTAEQEITNHTHDEAVTTNEVNGLLAVQTNTARLYLKDPLLKDEVTIVKEGDDSNVLSAEKIARMSVPLLFVEEGGSYTLRDRTTAADKRSLTLKSRHLSAVSQYLLREGYDTNSFSLPVFEMTIGYDTTTGEYELDRLGMGFFNERFWLMHELSETEDGPGTYGIQLKQKW